MVNTQAIAKAIGGKEWMGKSGVIRIYLPDREGYVELMDNDVINIDNVKRARFADVKAAIETLGYKTIRA